MRLKNKAAVVTGGGRGIGRAIALGLAREGADVLTFSRTHAEVESTAAAIRELGRRGIALRADVRRPEQVARAMDTAVARFGHIDILVNNAGIQGPIGRLHENELEAWRETLETSLLGIFLCCQRALPGMITRRQGKIINLSGGGAATPRPYFCAYAAAKAGVVRLTESLALELKPFDVHVNAIAPGAVFTRMLEEVLRAGEAAGPAALEDARRCREAGAAPLEKAVELAVFLASAESDGLTGRLLSAVWDDWREAVRHADWLERVGGYALRRIDTHMLKTINADWELGPADAPTAARQPRASVDAHSR